MDVTLRPKLQEFLDEQVAAGRFQTAAEMVEAGLARLMLDPLPDGLDEDDVIAIAESERQIERGEDLDWQEVSTDLRRRYLNKE